MIKEAQYHPVTEQIMHIDLLRVRRDEKMKISIPLVLEGNSVGVVQGGILTQTLSNIDIQCFPTDVPENIVVDITDLDLNASISAGDLKLDEDIILESVKKTGAIITCEEHNYIGGLGESIAGFLSKRKPTIQSYVATNDTFGESGTPRLLMKKYGLDSETIVEKTIKLIEKKNQLSSK